MRRRPTPGPDAGEGGFSLVEVLVTMIVMSLLGTAVVGTVSSVARASAAANSRITATTKAQTLADRLTKSLRSAHLMNTVPASAFTYADGRHVTFYTDAGDPFGPRMLDVNVTGTGTTQQETMVQVLKVPTAANTYPATGTSQALAPGDLDASTGTPVFTYYDPTGAVMTGVLTAAQMAAISRIRLTLTTHEPGLAVSTTVTSSVYLRNVEYR